MKVLVGAFNQEKALVASRGLLGDYKPSDRIRMELFEALVRPCPPAAVANSANIMQERKQFCETRPIIASSVVQ